MTRTQGSTGRALAALGVLLVAGCSLDRGAAPAADKLLPRRMEQTPASGGGAALGYASDRVLVRFGPEVADTDAEERLRACGFPSVHAIPAVRVFSVRTAPGASVAETLAALRRLDGVETARPDPRTRIADVPDDTYFAEYQYNLRNRGGVLDIGGGLRFPLTAGADIKAVPAWDEAKGDPEVVIAVLDTGVDQGHVDLSGKVVSSGRDFVNEDSDAYDDHWHGTHVAGIAAADTGNGAGIAGVAQRCRILPVKVVDETGNGFYSWMIDGIIWAADQGADVINISLGGDVPDPSLEDACRYAHDHGAVVVAAAGNESGRVLYPAAYDESVLAVAATDYNDAVTSFSSFGPEVDVAAPGAWILGPVPLAYVGPEELPYVFASGTSAAAPQVAGLAALIRSLKPELAPDQIMWIIRYTADDINLTTFPGRDDHAGFGRINMERALVPYILD